MLTSNLHVGEKQGLKRVITKPVSVTFQEMAAVQTAPLSESQQKRGVSRPDRFGLPALTTPEQEVKDSGPGLPKVTMSSTLESIVSIC
jgi:hypothetical protein